MPDEIYSNVLNYAKKSSCPKGFTKDNRQNVEKTLKRSTANDDNLERFNKVNG